MKTQISKKIFAFNFKFDLLVEHLMNTRHSFHIGVLMHSAISEKISWWDIYVTESRVSRAKACLKEYWSLCLLVDKANFDL